jgi:hypothetical protein
MPELRLLRSLRKRVAQLRYHDVEVFRARFSRRFGKEEPYQLHQGTRHHAGGVYAIFLIWQPDETPWYVDNALAAFDEGQANVILVVNHELSAERLLDLKSRCSRIIIRNNAGLDFGGYRDATLHLLENENPVRLLYLNDSVYFFKKGLTQLFQELAGSEADVAGSFENWQHSYHIQSFCFSVSQRNHQKPGVHEILARLPPGKFAPVGDPKRRDRILRGDPANRAFGHLNLFSRPGPTMSGRKRPQRHPAGKHLPLSGAAASSLCFQRRKPSRTGVEDLRADHQAFPDPHGWIPVQEIPRLPADEA